MKINVQYNNLSRVLKLLDETSFAVDTETNGLQPYRDTRMVGISFYFPLADETHYLSFRHEQGFNLPQGNIKTLADNWNYVLEKRIPQVVYFNALFDMHVMIQDGFNAPQNVVETMVSAKLLNENEHYSHGQQAGAYRLKRLAPKYLGAWADEGEADLLAKAKAQGFNAKKEMWRMDGADVAYYAGLDTYITYKLYEFYQPHIERWNLTQLQADENKFLRDFLFRAENNGAKIDVDKMQKLYAYEQERVNRIQQFVNRKLGDKFYTTSKRDRASGININLDSPKQVLSWLKDVDKRVKATDSDTLEKWQRETGKRTELGKRLQLLTTYRDANTPIKLYYKKYPDFLDANDFMHPNHFVGGARTGRLTCSNPNTQQISKKGEFKSIFIACGFDYKHVSVDLSQAELRVASHYCNEPTMLALMQAGEDLHSYTADALTTMLNRHIDRQLGKMANFGLLYRMSPAKASIKFGIDLDLATDLVMGWRQLYGNFELGYYSAMNIAQQWRKADGSQGTPFGHDSFQYFSLPYDERIRHFDEASRIRLQKERNGIYDVYKGGLYSAFGETKTADRDMVLYPYDEHYKAFNFLIQGTIQAVMRKGILELLTNYYPQERNALVRPKMTVYDSVLFDVHKSELNRFADVVRSIFYFDEFTVPLTVDIEYGDNYKEMRLI